MEHINFWLTLNGSQQFVIVSEWVTLACGWHRMGHISFWMTLNWSH